MAMPLPQQPPSFPLASSSSRCPSALPTSSPPLLSAQCRSLFAQTPATRPASLTPRVPSFVAAPSLSPAALPPGRSLDGRAASAASSCDAPGANRGRVWSAAELALVTGGRVAREGPAGRICTDTRQLQAGDWFLALQGERADGADFLPEALARGCAGALLSEEQAERVAPRWGAEQATPGEAGRREARRGAAEAAAPLRQAAGAAVAHHQPAPGEPAAGPPAAAAPCPSLVGAAAALPLQAPSAAPGVPCPLPSWPCGLLLLPGPPLQALHWLAAECRRRFPGPVVGVTGSVGKTSARRLAALALRGLGGHVHETAGNFNNHIGVPLTLLALPPDASACVLELGMSAPGEIALLSSLCRPSVRAVLNVGPCHLQQLGSLAAVAQAKAELLCDAKPGDTCVLNADDPRVKAMATGQAGRTVTFGSSPSASVRLLSSRLLDGGAAVEAVLATSLSCPLPSSPAATSPPQEQGAGRAPAEPVSAVLRLNSPGLHLAENAAAAAAIAVALGVPLPVAVQHMQAYEPVGMRMRLERMRRRGRPEEGPAMGTRASGALSSTSSNSLSPPSSPSSSSHCSSSPCSSSPCSSSPLLLLNDSYNANPMSMAAALRQLASMAQDPSGGTHSTGSRSESAGASASGLLCRRVAVLGDMRELGDRALQEHEAVLCLALSLHLDLVVLVGECFQEAWQVHEKLPSRLRKRQEEQATVAVCQDDQHSSSRPDGTAALALKDVEPSSSELDVQVELYASINDLVEAEWWKSLAEGDIVLLKGSRGMRMEQIREAINERWMLEE